MAVSGKREDTAVVNRRLRFDFENLAGPASSHHVGGTDARPNPRLEAEVGNDLALERPFSGRARRRRSVIQASGNVNS